MFCPACGSVVGESAAFCTNCGLPIATGMADARSAADVETSQLAPDAVAQSTPESEVAPAIEVAPSAKIETNPEPVIGAVPVPVTNQQAANQQGAYQLPSYGQPSQQDAYQQGAYQQPSYGQPNQQGAYQQPSYGQPNQPGYQPPNYQSAAQRQFPQTPQNRALAMCLYTGLVALIFGFVCRDYSDEFITHHLNQALVILIGTVIAVILSVVIIGILLGIFLFVVSIIGMVSAYNGTMYELPLIGKIKIIR